METTLICVGCGRAEGHSTACGGGGYTTREQLLAERDAEWIHRDHLLPREDCEFC